MRCVQTFCVEAMSWMEGSKWGLAPTGGTTRQVLVSPSRSQYGTLIMQLQIIVCSNGEAGVNFEHTGVDGHTVLRYAADVYTELVLLFAKVDLATRTQCSPPT